VIWNCGHMAHFKAREELRGKDGAYLHRFGWLKDNEIGDLPPSWNWLCDELGPNPHAKLLHWTAGYQASPITPIPPTLMNGREPCSM
jgi:hypothetical protein